MNELLKFENLCVDFDTPEGTVRAVDQVSFVVPQGETVGLVDTESGKEKLHILAHPKHADATFSASPCLAFAADSKTLASASTDHTIRLWDTTTARETGRFRAPDSAFYSIVFSKDDKKLVTGSSDTSVLIWDVNAAEPPTAEKSNVITLQ